MHTNKKNKNIVCLHPQPTRTNFHHGIHEAAVVPITVAILVAAAIAIVIVVAAVVAAIATTAVATAARFFHCLF